MSKILSVIVKLFFVKTILALFFSSIVLAQGTNMIRKTNCIHWVGGGVLTNDAFNLLDRQVRQGDAKAALQLASYYKFVGQDFEKEGEYLELAAKTGDDYAQLIYAEYLADNVDHPNFYDIDKAIYWAEKAARHNGENKEENALLIRLREEQRLQMFPK